MVGLLIVWAMAYAASIPVRQSYINALIPIVSAGIACVSFPFLLLARRENAPADLRADEENS